MSARNAYGQSIGDALQGWSERPRPTRTTLSGEYAVLAPLDPERHADELAAAFSAAADDRDWTYLAVERPASPPLFQQYLAKIAATDDPLHFSVLDAQSGRAVGTAALLRIEPAHGVIEVGYINYSPLLKQSRAGTEAMYLLMRYAFDALGYRRYEWKCDSLNAPSRKAAERYGFKFEGVFRNAVVYKGRSRDSAWYSIIQQEWPRVRSAFQSWLAAGNFDASGRQRRTLQSIRSAIP